MDLRFRERHKDARNPAALIRAGADGGDYGDTAHNAAMAHLFIPRGEDEGLDLAERAVAARAAGSSSSS